ncbi:MAG: MerR family transcriptional regulator [Blastocatellia bacterium AA13]|nr:MAG: MerR family transcriptional regulator [Blastocatellia bacterium AA13]
MEVRTRIPEKLYFRIGEVCELIKVQPHVLRYWESEFPMLTPQKNRAGQRVYRRKDVEMVFRIRDLLYEEKFTIAGAKKRLMDEQQSRTSARQKRSVPDEAEDHQDSLELFDADDYEPDSDPSHIEAEAAEYDEMEDPVPAEAQPKDETATRSKPGLSANSRRTIRAIRRELEGLLTMLDPNASIEP